LFARHPLCATSPQTPDKPLAEKLKTIVHLTPGRTTLAEVLKVVSEQTGLRVEAADYLREHRLIIVAPGLSTAALLNTLCEMNGWKWQVADDGRVMVDRPAVRTPITLADMPFAFRAALPPDLIRYMEIEEPIPSGPEKARFDLFKKHEVYDTAVLLPRVRSKINLRLQESARNFAEGMTFPSAPLPQLKYQDLDQERSQLLPRLLVLDALGRVCETPTFYEVLRGKLRSYQLTPGAAEITVNNGGIHVGAVNIHGVRQGFGASKPQ
jgi:hypothetical protein